NRQEQDRPRPSRPRPARARRARRRRSRPTREPRRPRRTSKPRTMTDDAHDPSAPDPHESALSALVDGVATADERALVEGSPELTAELAGLHAQRAALRDVPVPAAA